MKDVAIIPARGGSKRIPRKNIKLFHGEPIISWSIEAAKASGLFDRIIVSTDDGEIAGVARWFGAEVPFVRPPDLADDFAGTDEVVRHALLWLQSEGSVPENVCCIYPTAPMLSVAALTLGREALNRPGVEFAFSATTYAFPVQRALRLTAGGRVAPLDPSSIPKRSQDLEPIVHDAGQFYWGRAEAFLNRMEMYAEHSEAILLPSWQVQDIDSESDWTRAELMFEVAQRLKD